MNKLVIILSFSLLYSCAIFGQRSEKKTVEKCGFLPHCVSSVDTRDRFNIKPLKHKHKSIKEAKKEVLNYLKKQKRVKVEFENDNYIHATYESKLMGYIDDVEFLFTDNIVHIRSISRIGISDLGVNRERVEKIRKDVFNEM